ncbi:RteC domain-containing protein [Pedobacter borealis]|uniref:RteC domain-containing protein n=1 Tax=Pedobacter borealis TaxID=475254 RepID=UPI000492FD6C
MMAVPVLGLGLFCLFVYFFDNGKVGITEFFERMGRCFEIDLGLPKRGFDDLSSRKRLSRTHFLEVLWERLNKKFDDADAYDPGKGRY